MTLNRWPWAPGFLVPVVEAVTERCGQRPQKVSADIGFFTLPNLHSLESQGSGLYVPDSVAAKELNTGRRVKGAAPVRDPAQRRMQHKLRHPQGQTIYGQRKAIIERCLGYRKSNVACGASACGLGQGRHRTGTGLHRLQPHPDVAHGPGGNRPDLTTRSPDQASSAGGMDSVRSVAPRASGVTTHVAFKPAKSAQVSCPPSDLS